MGYEIIVTIKNGNGKEMQLTYKALFTYMDGQYGNGAMMEIDGADFYKAYDIRYDKSFHKGEEDIYLHRWAKERWSGENGAWLLTSFTVRDWH